MKRLARRPARSRRRRGARSSRIAATSEPRLGLGHRERGHRAAGDGVRRPSARASRALPARRIGSVPSAWSANTASASGEARRERLAREAAAAPVLAAGSARASRRRRAPRGASRASARAAASSRRLGRGARARARAKAPIVAPRARRARSSRNARIGVGIGDGIGAHREPRLALGAERLVGLAKVGVLHQLGLDLAPRASSAASRSIVRLVRRARAWSPRAPARARARASRASAVARRARRSCGTTRW